MESESINELALFAGGGGGLLATKYLLGWRTVCYVEKAKYAVEVLKARIRDEYLDDAPIWDDANTFNGQPWAGSVDIVSAGFPCQPFSLAGKRLGDKDERNGWDATIRIIRQVRPTFAWLENVASLTSHPYFGTILGDLAESGYGVIWNCLSAKAVGANHERNRLWILAYPESRSSDVRQLARKAKIYAQGNGKTQSIPNPIERKSRRLSQPKDERKAELGFSSQDVSHTNSERQPKFNASAFTNGSIFIGRSSDERTNDIKPTTRWWRSEPRLGRVAHGIPNRVDRHEILGNAQVPQVVRVAFLSLLDRLIERIKE